MTGTSRWSKWRPVGDISDQVFLDLLPSTSLLVKDDKPTLTHSEFDDLESSDELVFHLNDVEQCSTIENGRPINVLATSKIIFLIF